MVRGVVTALEAEDAGQLAEYGVCESVIRGDLATALSIASDAGVPRFCPSVASVRREGAATVATMLDDFGLSAGTLLAIEGIAVVHPDRDVLDRARRILDDAATIGCPAVLVVTGALGDRSVVDGDACCVAWLEAIAPAAAARGLVVALEPIHPIGRVISYVHSLAHAVRLVSDIEGSAVVVDTAHLYWDPALIDQVATCVDRIASVQLSNVSSSALAEGRYERDEFAVGDVDVGGLVDAILAAGYSGTFEDESTMRRPRSERAALVARNWAWFRERHGVSRRVEAEHHDALTRPPSTKSTWPVV